MTVHQSHSQNKSTSLYGELGFRPSNEAKTNNKIKEKNKNKNFNNLKSYKSYKI